MLRTERLVLDLPVEADTELVAHYCADPLFLKYLTTPWPYTTEHARAFLTEYIPVAWDSGDELTWAIRRADGAPLLGVIGLRRDHEIGFWLGAEHRGEALMAEAATAVSEWALGGAVAGAGAGAETLLWRANEGNLASAHVARAAGFRRITPRIATVPGRDGRTLAAWHAERRAEVEPDAYASWEPILEIVA
ncbi:GNAT family N-acetyltransferase [Agromyces sp. Root1464]|uniref:GNAT family N-acetyltransferase n=1 Tax=Agromyces sp. Root1464 TaxID=1736467 RepID=UPI00138F2586|nr:GNAT family N-acetyltransferase [Agromyces sp. Root1464]